MKLKYYSKTDSFYIDLSYKPSVETKEMLECVTVVAACNDATKFGCDGEPNAKLILADLKTGEHLRTCYRKDDNIASIVMITKQGSR